MDWLDWLIKASVELELHEVQAPVMLLDVLLRSFLLYCFASFVNEKFKNHATPGVRHKYLAVLLLNMGLLPVLPALAGRYFDPTPDLALLVLLFEANLSAEAAEKTLFTPNMVLATMYCLGVLYFLSKLMVACIGLRQLRNSADYRISKEDLKLLRQVQAEFEIGARIELAKSSELQSPVTFGFIKPLVLIPLDWVSWSHSEKLTVLRHELAHVKRADWLVNIAIGILLSLNWFNPFIWFLKNKVHSESEHDCDFKVLNLGSAKYAYAGQLLNLARASNGSSQLIQSTASMIDVGELTDRVDAILNYHARDAGPSGWFVKILMVVILAFGSVVASGRVITVEDASQFTEARLVYKQQPIYSSTNIFAGLEARTRLQFDIDERGRVVAESISVLRSSSPDIMVAPAVEALKQFRYEPRVAYGHAVTAADMEYEFSIGGYESRFNR